MQQNVLWRSGVFIDLGIPDLTIASKVYDAHSKMISCKFCLAPNILMWCDTSIVDIH